MLGANRAMLELILDLREKGVNPTVLLPYPIKKELGGLKSALIDNKIKFIEAPIRQIKHPHFMKLFLNYLYANFLNYCALRQLKEYKFDIVHSNTSVINIGYLLSKKIGAKHIWHLREFGDLDYKMKTPFCKYFQRVIYRGNNNFVAISQKIRQHFLPYIKGRDIHLIYDSIVAQEERKKIWNDPVQLCIVGFIHENKGQLDVLKAVDYLVNHLRIDKFHLTIVGDGNKETVSQLKRFVTQNNLSSYVSFTGYLKDVSEVLNKMHVGIMASHNEAFGRVTVEYMMNGLAVIASDGGANQEIVEDGRSGLIYPVGDYRELAKKMKYLIQNKECIKSFAHEGYCIALSKFSSQVNVAQVYNLYKSILN